MSIGAPGRVIHYVRHASPGAPIELARLAPDLVVSVIDTVSDQEALRLALDLLSAYQANQLANGVRGGGK